jgi:ubiquitin-conjugating enzyme E2 Q
MVDWKKIKELEAHQSTLEYKFYLDASIDDLSILNIYLTQITIANDSPVEQQMRELKIPHIHMEFRFSDKYPHEPPFVRIITPRFIARTGHITEGGSMCLQILTNQGWTPVCEIESLLRQILFVILDAAPIIDSARFHIPYALTEARTTFEHVRKIHEVHGW